MSILYPLRSSVRPVDLRRSARSLVALAVLGIALLGLAFPPAAGAASIVVDTDLDVDLANGLCSLREAIVAANTDAPYNDCPAGDGADRIRFALPQFTRIELNDDLPTITGSLAIQGRADGPLELDGLDQHRSFRFDPTSADASLILRDLHFGRGHSDTVGGAIAIEGGRVEIERIQIIDCAAETSGGGIAVSGGASVSLADSHLEFNAARGPGGGGLATVGTGGVVDIVRTSFRNNRAVESLGGGGALWIRRSKVTLASSTVSGNSANGAGGGIWVGSTAAGDTELTLRDVTVTDNTAAADLGPAGIGGGLAASKTSGHVFRLTVENSIIAGNFDLSAPVLEDLSCSSSLTDLTARSPSFIGSNEGCESVFPAGEPNLFGDLVGTSVAPLAPSLLPLTFQGSPYSAHHIPDVSVPSRVIDQSLCPAAVADQRQWGNAATGLRAVDEPTVPNLPGSDGCDFGSVELGGTPTATEIFSDGFELGHTLRWSREVP